MAGLSGRDKRSYSLEGLRCSDLLQTHKQLVGIVHSLLGPATCSSDTIWRWRYKVLYLVNQRENLPQIRNSNAPTCSKTTETTRSKKTNNKTNKKTKNKQKPHIKAQNVQIRQSSVFFFFLFPLSVRNLCLLCPRFLFRLRLLSLLVTSSLHM